jgi:hypothetical protein
MKTQTCSTMEQVFSPSSEVSLSTCAPNGMPSHKQSVPNWFSAYGCHTFDPMTLMELF